MRAIHQFKLQSFGCEVTLRSTENKNHASNRWWRMSITGGHQVLHRVSLPKQSARRFTNRCVAAKAELAPACAQIEANGIICEGHQGYSFAISTVLDYDSANLHIREIRLDKNVGDWMAKHSLAKVQIYLRKLRWNLPGFR